jgi:hypothetical protein
MTFWGWLALAWIVRGGRHPKPSRNTQPAGFRYTTAIAVGLILSLVSLPLALCLMAWPDPGITLNVICYTLILIVTGLMISAVYRERHTV